MDREAQRAPLGISPRVVNALLGGWLVASVFVWPRNGSEGLNALVTGLLVFGAAASAIWAPPLRFANVFFAAWLLVTTTFFGHVVAATLWNDVLVSAAIIVLAFVPSEPRRFPGAPARAPA